MKKENKKKIYMVSWVFFTIYFLCMVYFLFFCEKLGRVPRQTYQYNLKPFAEIMRFWNNKELLGNNSVYLNLLGNVICFIPFGFVIPILAPAMRHFKRTFFLSVIASVVVELIQLFTKLGSFDIDDIILNSFGGIIGYICFAIGLGLIHLRAKWKRRFGGKNGRKKAKK